MRAIYLLHEGDKTKIPVPDFYFNKYLHKLFTEKGRGIWNEERCEYVFNRKLDAKRLNRIIPESAIIQVDTIACNVKSVTGFFEMAWEGEKQDNEPVYFSCEWERKLKIELHARKYSPKTIKSYIHCNQAICRWLKKPPEKFTLSDVKNYLAHREHNENQSSASLNMSLSAIKFFFRNVMDSDLLYKELKRPKQDRRLPVVLSKQDIKRMIDLEKNLKHQLLLMIVYASGLRVSEVVKLKKEHIDNIRKSVMVHSGKGRKDRYTITSDLVIAAMKAYLKKYEITDWLFPGQPASRPLNTRSAQKVFDKALRRAGIEKTATIHSLRHSFATHLLESGIDITYIKDLLGHASVRTTERYAHVARRKALAIASPLDTIDEEE